MNSTMIQQLVKCVVTATNKMYSWSRLTVQVAISHTVQLSNKHYTWQLPNNLAVQQHTYTTVSVLMIIIHSFIVHWRMRRKSWTEQTRPVLAGCWLVWEQNRHYYTLT